MELPLKKDNFGGIYEKDTQASWKLEIIQDFLQESGNTRKSV